VHGLQGANPIGLAHHTSCWCGSQLVHHLRCSPPLQPGRGKWRPRRVPGCKGIRHRPHSPWQWRSPPQAAGKALHQQRPAAPSCSAEVVAAQGEAQLSRRRAGGLTTVGALRTAGSVSRLMPASARRARRGGTAGAIGHLAQRPLACGGEGDTRTAGSRGCRGPVLAELLICSQNTSAVRPQALKAWPALQHTTHLHLRWWRIQGAG